jgi:hypothetical protein
LIFRTLIFVCSKTCRFSFLAFFASKLCEQFTGCILGLGTAEACHHLQAISEAVLGLEKSRYSLP